MIYGVDISAYQPVFDFAGARREGYDFAFIKSTEGTGWKSSYYATQVAQARAAGFLVAAYHYVRGTDVQGQLRNIQSMVSTTTPVILDIEDGAGPISSIRELNAALNRAGYRTPLIYIPRWYWRDRMGSPDLSGLPPNWHSMYPDNVVRRKEAFVDQRPNGPNLSPQFPVFGGIETVVAQFTSSLAVANYPGGRIDGNAYRGTREQLAGLLSGQEEDPMPTPKELWEARIVNDGDGHEDLAKNWVIDANAHAFNALNEVRAMRQEMKAGFAGLSDDEAKIVAAVRAQPTGGQVDIEDLANRLRGTLGDTVADELAQRLTGGTPKENA